MSDGGSKTLFAVTLREGGSSGVVGKLSCLPVVIGEFLVDLWESLEDAVASESSV